MFQENKNKVILCLFFKTYEFYVSGKCTVGSMECLVFVGLLAFAGLCFVIILMAALHYVISNSNSSVKCGGRGGENGEFYQSSVSLINEGDISICDTIGAWIEAKLEAIFYLWGKMCTKHPIIVFFLGLAVSLVCSVGIYQLQVTTNPVALWSSPKSQARQEMDYFDKTFGCVIDFLCVF